MQRDVGSLPMCLVAVTELPYRIELIGRAAVAKSSRLPTQFRDDVFCSRDPAIPAKCGKGLLMACAGVAGTGV